MAKVSSKDRQKMRVLSTTSDTRPEASWHRDEFEPDYGLAE